MSALPIVLVHGGGFDSRCWGRLPVHLAGPVLAVDLPGRGAHPVPLRDVTFAECAATVRADVDAAGFAEIVLVGHSLAGCSMPAIIDGLGGRVRHAVFVACTVPDDGRSALDMLDAAMQERIRNAGRIDPRPMDLDRVRSLFGSDLTDEQIEWCHVRAVPEAPQLTMQPVDLAPLRTSMQRTWVRTLQDSVVPPARQLMYAANVGDCPVVDLDAGHMCMVSRPIELATIVNSIAEE